MILTVAMAVAMFPGPAIGILSRSLIDDLGLTRMNVGAVATAFALIEAAASLQFGGLADRRGGRRTLLVVLACSALGLAGMSMSWALWPLLIFAGFAGLAPAGANPATNHLIIRHVPAGTRGWITGFKQSGVQLGIFLAGIALPPLTLVLGWRWAIGLSAGAAILAFAATLLVIPPDREPVAQRVSAAERITLPEAVRWLTGYAALMGVGVAAYSTYLPLYAQEAVGLNLEQAGSLMAAFGLVGLIARISWGRVAEKVDHASIPLLWIALLSLSSALLLSAATPDRPWLIWMGAIVAGTGSASWMSVGMMAVMAIPGLKQTGRASATVTLAFALGLAMGPIAFGAAVDALGGYGTPLGAVASVFSLAAALMGAWRWRTTHELPDASPQ